MRLREGNQDPVELSGFLDLVSEIGAKRYCEIGCRNGDTFLAVMERIGPHGFGLAVDLPEDAASRASLSSTIIELRLADIACGEVFGNSRDPDVIRGVLAAAPFDLILIDGDHRFEGVANDFLIYSGMAPVVALHDVAAPDGHISDGHLNGVGRFWSEIKGQYRCREIVNPGSNMGFGVVFRGEA